MFCGKCGTELPEEANFCWKCGQPVKTATVKPATQVLYEYCRITFDWQPFGGLLPNGHWIAEVDMEEIARSREASLRSGEANRELVSHLSSLGWEPMGSDDRGNITVMRRVKGS